jgi:clan AA aspartic protease (TIGR02281 family)
MRVPHRQLPLLASVLVLAALALGAPRPAGSEIYRWTDGEGRVHFTQDLGQVPASQRSQAERAARARPERSNRLQTFKSPTPPARRAPRRSGAALQIPFEKQGNAMVVYARINDRVTAPFLVDTGASDVSIPASVAARAGVRIGPDTPRAVYHTANGLVSSPVVTLDSVTVGGARMEGVRGSVSESMNVGLLGGAFFNNFTFQVDPAAQIITLLPNEGVRKGLSQAQWRERFDEVREQLDSVDRYLEENNLTDDSRVADLERRRERLRGRLEELEQAADRDQVPQSWRE